jgi:hypothetical protein
MTDKVPGKPKADAATNVVVFGVDDDCKPHAGWFSKPDADRARTAAKQLRASISPLLAANWTSRSFGVRFWTPSLCAADLTGRRMTWLMTHAVHSDVLTRSGKVLPPS